MDTLLEIGKYVVVAGFYICVIVGVIAVTVLIYRSSNGPKR